MNSEIDDIVKQLSASGMFPKAFLDQMLIDFKKSQEASTAENLVDDILKDPPPSMHKE